MSDGTKVISGVFAGSTSPSEVERNHALKIFQQMITPKFLEDLNDVFIHNDAEPQSGIWKDFAGLVHRLTHPDASAEHVDEWQLFIIGAVKRDDVMMVKMCASELHTPDSMIDHPLMQQKLEIIACSPAQPYLRVVRQP